MPKLTENVERQRERFLASLSCDSPFYRLFDYLPEISFFAKDRHFRLMCASRHFLERFDFHEERAVIGRDDFELFPPRLAESFRRDDEQVLQTGVAKLNIVELFFNEQGVPDWFVTNKLPLWDRRGRVVGIMATIHSYEGRREVLHRDLQLDKAVAYIRTHFRLGVSVKELALALHISTRQLHRKFVDAFSLSPQSFMTKLRIQAACEMLQGSSTQISEVVTALGFCSQSAFTELFQKHVGLTPFKYQKQFQLRHPPAP